MRHLHSLLLILLAALALPAHAVLDERNLARTLSVLRAEMEQNYTEKKAYIQRLETQSKAQHQLLVSYMKRSEQVGLMLYSQKEENTFDLSFACQEATTLYRLLDSKLQPFDAIEGQLKRETERYEQLIASLEELPPSLKQQQAQAEQITATADSLHLSAAESRKLQQGLQAMTSAYTLTKAQQHDREKCLQLARELHRDLHNIQTRIKGDKVYYLSVKAKVEQLNTYAKERYKALQRSIFFEGGENYFSLLGNFDQAYQVALDDLKQKYSSLDGLSPTYSQWRGPMVKYMVLFVIFYIAVSIALAFAILRFLPQRLRPNDYAQKRKTYHTALGLFIFAISIFVVRLFIEPGFTMMAIQLMTNVAWLAIAIVCSLLVRLNGKKIQGALRLYLPFVLMAFVVVSLRVMFLPNSVVQLLFPPLLLGFAFWQVRTLRRPNANIPTSDVLYSAAAMIAICCSTVMAWMGYVMMAVQVIVWWMFQLAALQTINAIYHLMSRYERRVVFPRLINSLSAQEREGLNRDELIARIRQGAFITRTWGYDFVNRAVVPVFCVCSVFLSVWYAAGVFEVTDIVRESFAYNFINKPGLIQLSLHKLSFVVGFWFVFSYLNYAIRSFYQHITRMRGRLPAYQYNFTLANNVIAILVWGAYVLYALVLLQVPKSGIGVVTAGLATGMGFAMKDLLENFFYGISLMTGRVRVGDYIECDGVTGRVESITYQSTQIATLDGSIIAFLNTQLFNKNFKNLTRTHAYVMAKIPVGVGYGCDIQQVRQLVIEAIQPLDEQLPDGRQLLQPNSTIGVSFSNFGASSIDLTVWCWVLVDQQGGFQSRAREVIYNTLNAHQIEIPFPQVDVHMRN